METIKKNNKLCIEWIKKECERGDNCNNRHHILKKDIIDLLEKTEDLESKYIKYSYVIKKHNVNPDRLDRFLESNKITKNKISNEPIITKKTKKEKEDINIMEYFDNSKYTKIDILFQNNTKVKEKYGTKTPYIMEFYNDLINISLQESNNEFNALEDLAITLLNINKTKINQANINNKLKIINRCNEIYKEFGEELNNIIYNINYIRFIKNDEWDDWKMYLHNKIKIKNEHYNKDIKGKGKMKDISFTSTSKPIPEATSSSESTQIHRYNKLFDDIPWRKFNIGDKVFYKPSEDAKKKVPLIIKGWCIKCQIYPIPFGSENNYCYNCSDNLTDVSDD